MAQSLSTGAHNLRTLGKHPAQESVAAAVAAAAKSEERKKGLFFFLIKKTKRRGEGHLWTAPQFLLSDNLKDF